MCYYYEHIFCVLHQKVNILVPIFNHLVVVTTTHRWATLVYREILGQSLGPLPVSTAKWCRTLCKLIVFDFQATITLSRGWSKGVMRFGRGFFMRVHFSDKVRDQVNTLMVHL